MQTECGSCGSLVTMRVNAAGEVRCPRCGASLVGGLADEGPEGYDARPHLAPFIIVGILLIGGALYGAWWYIKDYQAKKAAGVIADSTPPPATPAPPGEKPRPAPSVPPAAPAEHVALDQKTRDQIIAKTKLLGWEPSKWEAIKVSGRWTQATIDELNEEEAEERKWREENAKRKAAGMPELPLPDKPAGYYTVTKAVKVSDGPHWAAFLVFKDGRAWAPLDENFNPPIHPDSWEDDIRRLISER